MMKLKLFLGLMVLAYIPITAFANQHYPLHVESILTLNVGHKINGYKYLCMENQGNQYDLEDKFNAFFKKMGFTILTEDEEEDLGEKEKRYVLYGSYQCTFATNEDGTMSNLTLTLRNSGGKIIFSSSKGGYALMSPRRGFEKASDKIINQIIGLNYSFDPKLVENDKNGKMDNTVDPVEEEKKRIARLMKADGMTTEQIEKYTGLTSEEIDK